MAAGVPLVVGLCASAVVIAALGAQDERPASDAGAYAVPQDLAGYSYVTGSVSSSPPGPAVALFQHGFGVEFMDFPQAVVLGAGGDTYRRVYVAEQRAGAETQGDPAPMLLSPDGRYVAVGDHDTDEPDVAVVDLTTGDVATHRLPEGRSVIPVAFSSDGTSLANLLSSEPSNPYSGGRIKGRVGVLDLAGGTTSVRDEGDATGAAFSPDGSAVAVDRTGADGVVLTLVQGDAERDVRAEGVLAGPGAWSPDGRLIAITTVDPSTAPAGVDAPGVPVGLSFLDATGEGGAVPAPLTLPLAGPGRVLGWDGSDAVLVLLAVEGVDTYTLSRVPVDGSKPTTLMEMDDLGSYGVGRFQLASAAAPGLTVVDPTGVDRGPWPWPLRIGAALVAGVLAWVAVRVALRVVGRARRRRTA